MLLNAVSENNEVLREHWVNFIILPNIYLYCGIIIFLLYRSNKIIMFQIFFMCNMKFHVYDLMK